MSVSRSPTFAEPEGQKTTCPVGIKVAPEKLPPDAAEFEYARATGSNIPTFAVVGVNMIFPDGNRQAPPKDV